MFQAEKPELASDPRPEPATLSTLLSPQSTAELQSLSQGLLWTFWQRCRRRTEEPN